MSLEQIGYMLLVIGLFIVVYTQKKQIDNLKVRIEQLRNPQDSNTRKDKRLVYLEEHLSHLNHVQAVKALREKYPELSLIEANELWKQKNH
ncbi:hypothetical protein [Psychrobacter sp.]|uniref:hypothetical protein n=1 Tax=Psychrobacter sp. TaxID=56811 RepID=UPI0025D18B9D|nr:hypothetical protein [Psychrobacter sp.]